MSEAMKTRLWYAAVEDLCTLSGVSEGCFEWVTQMQGGLLIDAGDDDNHLLQCADQEERVRIMQKAASDRLFDTKEFDNLVFVFGEEKPVIFLHAVRIGQSWNLRIVIRQENGYLFCPAMGVLDIDVTGMDVKAWPLGGAPREDNSITAFTLMDCAITAFSRMGGYKKKVFQHRVGHLHFASRAIAA